MGNSLAVSEKQHNFYSHFISNNYSSGTISKAKYILHCKCNTFVSGWFWHKHYLVHKRRKFSSYKILNWKYVSNILFIHLCGIGKYSQIASLIKDSESWKLLLHWILWCLKTIHLRTYILNIMTQMRKISHLTTIPTIFRYSISTVDWLATDFIKQFIKYSDVTWWITTSYSNLKAHPNKHHHCFRSATEDAKTQKVCLSEGCI